MGAVRLLKHLSYLLPGLGGFGGGVASRSYVLSLSLAEPWEYIHKRLTLDLNRGDSIFPFQSTFLALHLLLAEQCVWVMSENIY